MAIIRTVDLKGRVMASVERLSEAGSTTQTGLFPKRMIRSRSNQRTDAGSLERQRQNNDYGTQKQELSVNADAETIPCSRQPEGKG